MRGFRVLRVASLAGLVLLATCDDQQQLFDPTAPPFQITDAAHAGHNLDFFFLPPLVPDPSGHLAFDDGGFDGGQSPVVEICQLDGEICDASQPDDFPVTYSMTDGVGSEVVRVSVPDEHYLVNWHTNEFTLDTGVTYRIIVSVAGTELGSADVDVVSSGKELKNVDTDHYIALKDGRTLPIKFRIEHGAVHVVDAAGGTVTAVDGDVTLDLAADAVSRPVGITVMPASDYPPHEAMVPGTAFDLGPDGQTFAGQVFLTIAYDEAQFTGTDETSLRIHKAVGETWEPVPDGIVDLEANTATVRLDGFSTYSVIQRGLRPIPSEYRIFFQSIRTGNWDIYAQAPDGDPYPVIDDAGNDIHPAVSHDGNWLAFANRGGSGELYVSHVSGTDVRQVTSNFGVVRLPAWSPDGTKLAFAAFADGVGDVYVINADGSGEPVNLTADNPTDDSHPDWSPDGRQIVFTSNRDGNYDLYVTAADGSTTPWKVDPDYEYDALDPSWAPDGMWTAFVSHEYGQEDILKHIEIWGAVRLRLTHADAMDWNAQWSPNGEHIVFSSRRDGNAEIYVMNADGSGQTNLTNHPAADSRPVWGKVPSGTLYEVGPEGGAVAAEEGTVLLDVPPGALSESTWISIEPSSTFPTNIATAPGSVFDFGPEGIEFALPVTLTLTYDPATIPAGVAEESLLLGHVVDGVWILMETQVNTVDHTVSGPIAGFSTYGILAPTTPTLSASLAFTSNRDGDHEIYTTDGVVEQQITDNSVDDRYPDWLGDQILFVSDGDIYLVSAGGGSATNLTNTPGVDETVPSWSPDGTSIAFVRQMSNGYDVWVMNADGSNQTNLTSAPEDDAGPVWSPDGSTIAFHTDRDGNLEVYVMNADGSNQVNRTNDPDWDDSSPAWSPDGSRIVYAKYEPGVEGDLWIMDPSGSNHENLTKSSFGLTSAPAWSPDGTQIAFAMWGPPSWNDDVWVIAADGSIAGPVVVNAAAGAGSPAWQKPPPEPQATLVWWDETPDLEVGWKSFSGIWGSSATDIWAVGEAGDLAHYDGATWTGVPQNLTDVWLQDVWGSGPTDVWAVGGDILHYDGTSWSNVGSSVAGLFGVWGSGPTDVWAVGGHGTILHYDGTGWVDATPPFSFRIEWLSGIWGSGPTDVWAVGTSTSFECVTLHYDGATWTEVTCNPAGPLTAAWGTGPTDVWAVGNSGEIRHYDGEYWRRGYPLGEHPTSADLYDVWGSGSDVWAVGTGGTIVQFDGVSWTDVTPGLTTGWLSGIWGTALGNIWAVGASEAMGEPGAIVHFDGASWTDETPTHDGGWRSLQGIWGSSATDIWAVGEAGDLAHYDGATWTGVPQNLTDVWLQDVWGSGPTDVWAVGGDILHYDGTSWSNVGSSVAGLFGVWGSGPTDVWAVGGHGTILHYDGTGWVDATPPFSFRIEWLSGIWGSGPTDVWAVGTSTSFECVTLHYDGATWTEVTCNPAGPLTAAWGTGPTDVWAVGNSGEIRHYDGEYWRRGYPLGEHPTSADLYDVWGSGSDVWAVGTGGTIVQFDGVSWTDVTPGLTTGWLSGIWGTALGNIWAVGEQTRPTASGTILRGERVQ